jgi:predicted transposase YbfD/YdcC
LLKVLDLNGALVTIDAAGCQKATLEQVREQGGDYLVTVKGNQPALRRAVHAAFDRACEAGFAGCDMAASVEDGHGRHEERYVTVIRDPEGMPGGWADVGAVVLVGREREVKGRNASAAHYYLTSLRLPAAELGRLIRGHWAVENGLHWCLDVSFREDANRTRDANAGANLGVVRRVAASLLKQDPGRGSIKAKRLSAALDEKYLGRVLRGFKAN